MMAFDVHDYLIDQSGIEWQTVLASWAWLLPREVTPWLMTRLADLFVVFTDGSVHRLDVACGTLTKVANSRDNFFTKIDQPDVFEDWFAVPLVKELVTSGVMLAPGQCYGFKLPPVLGFEYDIQNIAPISIADYLGAAGAMHEQLLGLPDGTEVVLKVINSPT